MLKKLKYLVLFEQYKLEFPENVNDDQYKMDFDKNVNNKLSDVKSDNLNAENAFLDIMAYEFEYRIQNYNAEYYTDAELKKLGLVSKEGLNIILKNKYNYKSFNEESTLNVKNYISNIKENALQRDGVDLDSYKQTGVGYLIQYLYQWGEYDEGMWVSELPHKIIKYLTSTIKQGRSPVIDESDKSFNTLKLTLDVGTSPRRNNVISQPKNVMVMDDVGDGVEDKDMGQKKFSVKYITSEDDHSSVWVYARDEEHAKEVAYDEYHDIKEIQIVREIS